jgi:predicted peptidase
MYDFIKYSNKLKHIRGVNGGRSKVFVVHPLTDPCTPLDGSFISYNKKKVIERNNNIKTNTSHIPSNGIIL